MINRIKLKEQVDLFKQKLTPSQMQQDALELAAKETMQKLITEAETKFQPIERVFLVAICGEINTRQKQAEFVSRLILLDMLLK